MQHPNSITREQFVLHLAGSLSLTAALIHAMVMPEHFQEWWGYGLFFLIVACAQAIYGIALVLRAWGMSQSGSVEYLWANHARALYLAGIIANVALIVLYVITRTAGIPLGPHAGEVETASTISIVSKIVELALVGCLIFLLTGLRDLVPHQYAVAEEQ